MSLQKCENWDSAFGAVGRAVDSEPRDPRSASSHRPNLYVLLTVLKRRKQIKRGQEWPIF